MNILPKKSWHVRTKKNIERVRRDEAEAERIAKDERARRLVVEQETRARELRSRAGIAEETNNPFTLSQGDHDYKDALVEAEDRTKLREVERWQEKVGISKRLVRSDDINQPWYCISSKAGDAYHKSRGGLKPGNSGTMPNLIAQMYDPLTAIKKAEEIVRSRRKITTLAKIEPTLQQSSPNVQDSDSSLEIVKEVRPKMKKEKHHSRKKKGKSGDGRNHKQKSHHRKHKSRSREKK